MRNQIKKNQLCSMWYLYKLMAEFRQKIATGLLQGNNRLFAKMLEIIAELEQLEKEEGLE